MKKEATDMGEGNEPRSAAVPTEADEEAGFGDEELRKTATRIKQAAKELSDLRVADAKRRRPHQVILPEEQASDDTENNP